MRGTMCHSGTATGCGRCTSPSPGGWRSRAGVSEWGRGGGLLRWSAMVLFSGKQKSKSIPAGIRRMDAGRAYPSGKRVASRKGCRAWPGLQVPNSACCLQHARCG
ncbi:protein of unknown function (plasmid) [Cupriavidus neocaledonicus]|uniref:Uncharacterized protein n=1 Tax=Cupriavidus neocaledonicus TaxID=1040979 RepID=A0A375HTV9_9BURK|nr:hypothetical protein CBM2605_B80020 [Cupriavidus neocaledonicus]SPD60446.1 protein of unknown function [Cupriavidus neocaledonicus]